MNIVFESQSFVWRQKQRLSDPAQSFDCQPLCRARNESLDQVSKGAEAASEFSHLEPSPGQLPGPPFFLLTSSASGTLAERPGGLHSTVQSLKVQGRALG